ncbi:hypothetical protein NC652_035333 [Populus alba x Populus x berolinensis]|nr:hypothetical protein NC652_035333 [Populus alba x Populus x berolinensis]
MSFKKHGPCGAFASSFFNLPIQNRRRLNESSPFQRSKYFISIKQTKLCVYKRRKETPFFIFLSCLSFWVFKILSLFKKNPKKDRSSSFTSKAIILDAFGRSGERLML